MANSKQRRAQARQKPASNTSDSFANFGARVGFGTQNQSSGASYQFDFISRNRIQLEAAYRSSWIVGQAVDVVAEDMTKEGIDLDAETDPKDIAKMHGAAKRLQLWDKLCDAIKWARLYGGAIAVMLIDGQDLSTPLNADSIKQGQFKGLLVLDRWLLNAPNGITDIVKDLGPNLGMPIHYTVIADSQALPAMKIHYTRCIRIDGVDLPYWQRLSENTWGQSIIERLWDRLISFDSTTMGIAQLTYKAHLRTYSVEKLREILALGGQALNGLLANIDMMRQYQTNEGITLVDTRDKFETHQYSFSGLSDVLDKFGEQLAGALQVPLVRLFGQSPKGFSTGDTDIENYNSRIAQDQERRLRTGIYLLYDVLSRSVRGKPMEEGWDFHFKPLGKLSEQDKADIAQKVTATIMSAVADGTVDQATALKELKQSSRTTGVWSNITDEQITEAENAPPIGSELLNGDPQAEPGQEKESGPNSGARAPLRRAA